VLLRAQPRPPVGAFSFLILVLAAIVIAACGGSAPGRTSAQSGPAAAPAQTAASASGVTRDTAVAEGVDPAEDATSGPSATSPGAGPVRRIVSLAPNITEILFALGFGDRVVGVTEFCNYPPEALRLPKVGGFVNPNAEVILALHPDLVVATPNVGNRAFVERLIAVGARVVVVQARDVAEIDPAIKAIANAAGDPRAGRALVARLRADLDRERGRVASLPRTRTLFCIQVEPLVVAGRGSYPGDLIELAGGENIVPASAGQYPNFSLEAVVAAAPDSIVQSLMDTREGATGGDRLMAFWGRLGSIPAVKGKRVFAVPGDVVLRPGPRVAQGVAALIALLHPEAAPEAPATSVPK